ncbi:MAG TPA: hypothetical protein VGJ70_09570 [Solirubrobacteraceae bacterium]|jgi:hypothetical protein
MSASVLERLRHLPAAVHFSAQYRTGALRADRRLARLARGDGPIVAGPFRSEIGFEVLYWIPLLRWFVETYDVDPRRIVAVSRGGPESWYRDVAGGYADIFDHFSPAELKAWHTRQLEATGSQKQLAFSETDRAIVERVSHASGLENPAVLHPSLMYGLFRAYFAGHQPIATVLRRTSFRPLPDPGPAPDLPDDYVAVKVYYSACFPETPENRRFTAELIARLVATRDVVLLTTNLDLDDHRDYDAGAAERVRTIDDLVTPRNNLDLQTRVIAGARGLVTTYGGFAYLGPFLGVPSCAFHSNERYIAGHLAVMRRATNDLRESGANVGFTALPAAELPLVDDLLWPASTVLR